jgi:hypothetical protein
MSTEVYDESPKQSLTERIVQQGELAYNPELPVQDRNATEADFKSLLER